MYVVLKFQFLFSYLYIFSFSDHPVHKLCAKSERLYLYFLHYSPSPSILLSQLLFSSSPLLKEHFLSENLLSENLLSENLLSENLLSENL